ncbi:hypothetical protein [Paenibacillus lentus]|uniref:hypothetical protein n=1 Tax=Paenibacillus lentus TaxID=1338368 RepID=UPI001FE54E92|nr:hypothetical protein [Paenibacillus lentus]
MPAVLTECLFIDVAADAGRFKRPEVIEAIIQGHVSGLAKYLGLKRKEGAAVANKAPDWKAIDTVDIGMLGTILGRLIK